MCTKAVFMRKTHTSLLFKLYGNHAPQTVAGLQVHMDVKSRKGYCSDNFWSGFEGAEKANAHRQESQSYFTWANEHRWEV